MKALLDHEFDQMVAFSKYVVASDKLCDHDLVICFQLHTHIRVSAT